MSASARRPPDRAPGVPIGRATGRGGAPSAKPCIGPHPPALGRDSIAGSCAWSTSGRGFRAGAAFNGPRPRFHRRVVRVEQHLARVRGLRGIAGPSAAIRSPGRARGARVGEASGSGRRSTALGGNSIAGSCAWSNNRPGFGVGAASVRTCWRVLRRAVRRGARSGRREGAHGARKRRGRPTRGACQGPERAPIRAWSSNPRP